MPAWFQRRTFFYGDGLKLHVQRARRASLNAGTQRTLSPAEVTTLIRKVESMRTREQQPVLIEQTSKRIKVVQLAGLLMIAGGVGAVCAGAVLPTIPAAGAVIVFGLGLFVFGFVFSLVAALVAWWHHG